MQIFRQFKKKKNQKKHFSNIDYETLDDFFSKTSFFNNNNNSKWIKHFRNNNVEEDLINFLTNIITSSLLSIIQKKKFCSILSQFYIFSRFKRRISKNSLLALIFGYISKKILQCVKQFSHTGMLIFTMINKSFSAA